MCSPWDIPQTISAPFGADEHDTPLEYAETACRLFADLGVRGISVLFASGDDGVRKGNCEVNGVVQFTPMFPASRARLIPGASIPNTCTSGSGLHFATVCRSLCHSRRRHDRTQRGPEKGAPLSGGGFSNHFLRPDFQAERMFLPTLGTLVNSTPASSMFCGHSQT